MKNILASAFLLFALMPLSNAHAMPSEKQLAAEAKITRNAAEHIALAQVPAGRVASGELEREHGKLIWSFDIAQNGTHDIKEIQVDAKNGKIVSVQIETSKDQAKEAAQDKKK